ARRQRALETELVEVRNAQDQVRQQLEKSEKELQSHKQGSGERAKLEAKVTELQTNRAAREERMKSLVNVLTVQTDRRSSAEHVTIQLAKRQGELEAELAGHKKAQEHLRKELERTQKQQKTNEENAAAEQSKLETRQQELQ